VTEAETNLWARVYTMALDVMLTAYASAGHPAGADAAAGMRAAAGQEADAAVALMRGRNDA
jgi:hypothetical protein